MIFGFAILATALLLSIVAAYYSVAGLTAIFSAATIPVIIMGASLELGKIVATVWLHNNWKRAGILFKMYLIPAVAFLMLLTSMGIFGYLSKAHSDQSLVSGDAVAKVAIYDEKIKISKENIDANRRALKQMDEAVDQVMGRSTDEKGADKAVAIRRSQQKERSRMLAEIETEQKKITSLNEERAPLAAEFRKVESEVGPIKYIAALVYGENPDANVLERAVRLVIIMIVLVFDPLALTLILAANKQFEWARQGTGGFVHDEPEPKPKYEPDDGPLTTDQIDQIRASVNPHPPGWMFDSSNTDTSITDHVVDNIDENDENEKAAIRAWKTVNPDDTIKRQRQLYDDGKIERLPWDLEADNELPKANMRGFGTQWPTDPVKGDTFLRVDRLPSALYKYNGKNWFEIDKNISDQYSYNTAYIDHLISKIDSGEYDPDLLTEAELEQIHQRFVNSENPT